MADLQLVYIVFFKNGRFVEIDKIGHAHEKFLRGLDKQVLLYISEKVRIIRINFPADAT